MKPPTQRQLQVGEELRHALAEILLRRDTHIAELDRASITVTEVRISPDLKNATAYFMPLAGREAEAIFKLLNLHAPHLRHLISGKVRLRYIPKLRFKLDRSFEEAEKINALMNLPEVQKDLRSGSTPAEI